MTDTSAESVPDLVDSIYRTESRRVFATLVRLLGDFDLAEESLSDAFAAALQQWPREGVPDNPRAWLVSAGRFKAIDAMRRRARFDASLETLAQRIDTSENELTNEEQVADDRLRLIFTCCHPAIDPKIQVPLTLREVCGLTTEEIASAFLTSPPTMAQRIVRGKAKIRDAKIPFAIPSLADLPERIEAVLSVIYLVFNEGYSASAGAEVTRTDLSDEAIRLARLLLQLLPDPEVMGLLALMLLHSSRRTARLSPEGDIILLEDQDRELWDRDLIAEGKSLVQSSLSSGHFGEYTIQAAISAVHADAANAAETDWQQIVAHYDLLLRAAPSPVVELNRAVAIAMCDGPEAGLALIEAILQRGDLTEYYLAYSAQGELLRRMGRLAEAQSSFNHSLTLAKQEPERRFLSKKIAMLKETADQ
ncbi:RNA polymerase sigma factor [Bythopirellula polymerisocia]|uniref:RNA polymerase sigma factor n=1 Tax=Bythopirellula polymerisocia TaxID=2528003 RepID=A0A5C6D0H6_9BACT|nr:RNA polymerase sigma factor [Bythopirellula polymerisocia]TWU29267.1 RNA polymerase sigma factor [Bythopirellula polymerisocia]